MKWLPQRWNWKIVFAASRHLRRVMTTCHQVAGSAAEVVPHLTQPTGMSTTTARTISPIPPSSASARNSPSSDQHVSHLHDKFTAPYLQKGRGKGSHFRRKVEKRKEHLRKQLPVTPVEKNVVIKKSLKTSLQKNTEWTNEKSMKDDHDKRG